MRTSTRARASVISVALAVTPHWAMCTGATRVTPWTMNAEGATFDAGSDDVVFGTESKRVYHWPAANYQK